MLETSSQDHSLDNDELTDEKYLYVKAAERERYQVPLSNLKFAAAGIATLVTYKAVSWSLFFGFGLAWSLGLSPLMLLAGYWIAISILKYVFSRISIDESRRIEGWVFSESLILRQFSKYTETYPVAAIFQVDEKPDSVSFHYTSGDSDTLYRNEVESDEDWAFVLKSLKAKHEDYNKAFNTVPSISDDELTISTAYSSNEERAFRRLSAPGNIPLWKCLLYEVRNLFFYTGALLLLLHRPGRAFDFHDATCLVLLQVIQSVMLGNSPISTWFATRFARVGRIRYWSFSEDGLRSSEVFGAVRRGMGNSYKQITRYWSELTSIEEITEGLVLRFDDSTEAALIPKNSIPLKQWDSVLSHLRGLRLEIAN